MSSEAELRNGPAAVESTSGEPARAESAKSGSAESGSAESGAAESMPPRPARRRLTWTPSRVLVLLVAVGFFFGPAIAGALGVRAGEIENRRLVSFPSLSAGWDVFPQLGTWAVDHLPLRDKAVRLSAEMSQRVFGEPPAYGGNTSHVVEGKDGWLFYGYDVEWACDPHKSPQEAVAQANRLAAIVRKAGARIVLAVPPDKSSIEADKLPKHYENAGCAPRMKQQFWNYIGTHHPEGYVDVYSAVRTLRQQQGPVFRTKDTHWAPVAAERYSRLLVDAIDPTLWQAGEVTDAGQQSAVGDLTRVLGAPEDNTFEGVDVRRPGVTVPPFKGARLGHMGVAISTVTSTGAPLYDGPVLVLGDSFTGISYPQIRPYFADLTSVDINTAPKHPDDLAKAMVNSKVVVVESVERAFATGRVGLFDQANLDELERAVDRQLAARQATK